MAATTDSKLLKQTKFPAEFNKRVDVRKVNIEVMKKWIAGKISEILGNEDDVVIELCFNLLEGSRFPDIKHLQIQLTGFLDKDTAPFCKELWDLCLSAQTNSQGVPKELLEAKKLELIQEKLEAEKAAETARQQEDEERRREQELQSVKRREREERGGARRGRQPPPRGSDRRSYRTSRSPSPPSRRRSPDKYRDGSFRGRADTYVPTGRRAVTGEEDRGRRLSKAASRSPSRPSPRSAGPPRNSRRDNTGRGRRREGSAGSSHSPDRRETKRRRRDSFGRDDRGTRSRPRHRQSQSPSTEMRGRRNTSSASPSASRSPPPTGRHAEDRRPQSSSRSGSLSPARSASRSGSAEPRERGGPSKRSSPSKSMSDTKKETRADVTKERESPRDERRVDRDRKRRYRGDRELPRRPKARSRSPRPSTNDRPRSRSGSRSNRKRRHSIVRYEPAGKRQQRKSPSTSPSSQTRKKVADTAKKGGSYVSPQPDATKKPDTSSNAEGDEVASHGEKRKVSRLTETELRERIMKEKVRAMRRSS